MPKHNVDTARRSYDAVLSAVKHKQKVKIQIQKVSGSRMYAARATLAKDNPKTNLEWDERDRGLMTFLRKMSAIDPKTNKVKAYDGSTLSVIGRGDGASKIVLNQAQSAKAHTIEKAMSRYFFAVMGKKSPRVICGELMENAELSEGLGEDDFEGSDVPPSLSDDDRDELESLFVDAVAVDGSNAEIIDEKLLKKIDDSLDGTIVGNPFDRDTDISDEEMSRADAALTEKRREKEKARLERDKEAEEKRAKGLSEAFRANVSADVSHIVATQFHINQLTGERNRSTQAAVTRMITTALEDMALASSSEEEQRRNTQSRMLGLQLALSFPQNLRETQRMANEAAKTHGNPWQNLSPADRNRLKALIEDHEIHDQHDLVQHLFEIARAQALDLKKSASGAGAEFWGGIEPHKSTPRKFYFFTGAFEAARDGEKLKLLERYILMVKRLKDHPERLVDMLSLQENGTTLGWDYANDWPPPTWWERNRFMISSPQVALVNKATAATMALITPSLQQLDEFKMDFQQQKNGSIFQRINDTIAMRRSRNAAAPADLEAAQFDADPEYRNPMQGVIHNLDKLADALADYEPVEDYVIVDAGGESSSEPAAKALYFKALVDELRGAGLDDLLGEIDGAESEEILIARVEVAREMATEFKQKAQACANAADGTPSKEQEAAARIVAYLDETLDVLAEIDSRRILTAAIQALAGGYRKAQEAMSPGTARHKPLAQVGEAMLPFYLGEHELLLERIVAAKPTERADAIKEAETALAAAPRKLERGLATRENMGNDDDRSQLEMLRDHVLAAMRPALLDALSRVRTLSDRVEQGAAA